MSHATSKIAWLLFFWTSRRPKKRSKRKSL